MAIVKENNYNVTQEEMDILKEYIQNHYADRGNNVFPLPYSTIIGMGEGAYYNYKKNNAGDMPWPSDRNKKIGSFLFRKSTKVGRGMYRINLDSLTKKSKQTKQKKYIAPTTPTPPVTFGDVSMTTLTKNVAAVENDGGIPIAVPSKDKLFIPFGAYDDIKKVVGSDVFFPILISGDTRNGKTMMVQQSCAETGKKMVRVNLTAETDEDSLIGGLRLKDGNTVFEEGPVLRAMRQGAKLLLDEIDLADPARIMCMQSILEGNGYYVKKTGVYVTPAKGFNILATANTKGRGDITGRYIATNILNEAFLERFPIWIEHDYPNAKVEKRIVKTVFSSLGITDDLFAEQLVDWAQDIRGANKKGTLEETVTTGRLTLIANTYAIFQDQQKAIALCIQRFSPESRDAFMKVWNAKITPTPESKKSVTDTIDALIKDSKNFKQNSF